MNSIQTSAFKVLNLQPITVEKENQVSDYAAKVIDYVPSAQSVQNQAKEMVSKISFRDIFKKGGGEFTHQASSRGSFEENPQTNVSILTDTLDHETKGNG